MAAAIGLGACFKAREADPPPDDEEMAAVPMPTSDAGPPPAAPPPAPGDTLSAHLARTPWPIYQHDLKRTGRTAAVGPRWPRLRWESPTLTRGFPAGAEDVRGATIGVDGHLLVAAGMAGQFKLDRGSGAVLWHRVAEGWPGKAAEYQPVCKQDFPGSNEKWFEWPPTILADGTALAVTEYNWLLALDHVTGAVRWRVLTCKSESSPPVDLKGNVYAAGWDGKLYSYRASPLGGGGDESEARRNWTHRFSPDDGFNYTYGSPAVAPDGTVYHAWGGLWAHDPAAAAPKWHVPVKEDKWSDVGYYGPAISPDNQSAYYTKLGKLHAFDLAAPRGRLRWSVTLGTSTRGRTPAIGLDGTIYLGVNGKLVAVNPDGSTRWSLATSCNDTRSATMIDGAGTVYLNTRCGPELTGRLHAVNPDGTVKWTFDLPVHTPKYNGGFTDQALAMDGDGTIYVPSSCRTLAAIGETR